MKGRYTFRSLGGALWMLRYCGQDRWSFLATTAGLALLRLIARNGVSPRNVTRGLLALEEARLIELTWKA